MPKNSPFRLSVLAFTASLVVAGGLAAAGPEEEDRSPEQSEISASGEAAGGDVQPQGRPRPLTEGSCKVEVTIVDGGKTRGGEHEARVTFRNAGQTPVGEVLLVIEADPMSYWGNAPGGLSVFPDGKVDLFFAGPEGDPFLRAGQSKTIPVYHGGDAKFRLGKVECSSEEIFRRMLERIDVAGRFGKLAPYAESSLRSLYLSENGWKDILSTSGARDSGEVGRRYFFSSLADNCLNVIAVGVGMVAAGAESAPEDERGYMAETSFGEARIAFEEGRLDDAVELLKRVLILEPDNAMALNNLAYIMLRRGDSAGDASPFIEQAIKADPTQPGFQNTLSILRWKQGNKEEAIRLAQQAYSGSGGEILETKLNLAEWGGEIPALGDEDDTEAGGGGGEDDQDVPEKESPEGEGVSTSDTIPASAGTEKP